MIDFYTWTTPNGYKIAIALEEMGLDYTAHAINLGKGEQFAPEFLKIAPNNKIPAIVDHDAPNGPVSLFESGAILTYLALKTGKLLSEDPAKRAQELQWLNWQAGGYGPILGQYYHFADRREDNPYAMKRFTDEAKRLHDVLNTQLQGRDYVADAYSIADIALYPWAKVIIDRVADDTQQDWPEIRRWMKIISARAAVGRGYQVPVI